MKAWGPRSRQRSFMVAGEETLVLRVIARLAAGLELSDATQPAIDVLGVRTFGNTRLPPGCAVGGIAGSKLKVAFFGTRLFGERQSWQGERRKNSYQNQTAHRNPPT